MSYAEEMKDLALKVKDKGFMHQKLVKNLLSIIYREVESQANNGLFNLSFNYNEFDYDVRYKRYAWKEVFSKLDADGFEWEEFENCNGLEGFTVSWE
jgi:hypothetical protein